MSISSLREISILVSRYHVRFFFYTVVRSTYNSTITYKSINKLEEISRCMHRWQIWCNRKKREICIDRYSKKYNKNFLMWNRYHIIIEYFMRVILFFFLIKLLLVILLETMKFIGYYFMASILFDFSFSLILWQVTIISKVSSVTYCNMITWDYEDRMKTN